MKRLIYSLIVFIAAMILMGIVGRMDVTEQVIYTMPNETYRAIKSSHPEFSEVQIAEYYLNNK